jgi:hypothetical protein
MAATATVHLLPKATEQLLAVAVSSSSPAARPSSGPATWTRRELLLW